MDVVRICNLKYNFCVWDIINKISAIAGIIGLLASVAAFFQARSAKNAAENAGNFVKLRTTAYEILEISYLCKLESTISFTEARVRYKNINDKVQKIIGSYEGADLNDDILKNIKALLQNIKDKLNELSPNPTSEEGVNIYFYLADSFDTLSGELNKLNGVLEKQLINK